MEKKTDKAGTGRVRVRCLGHGPDHYFLSTGKFHRICSRCQANRDKRRELDPTVHDCRRGSGRHYSQDTKEG